MLNQKAFFSFTIAFILFLTACNNKNTSTSSSGFELSGTLSGGGEGINIYLDRISPDGIKHLDSTKLANGGTFTFHTNGIYKGFYTLRITQSDFATLILDSTEKVHVEGNSQFLGNTYTVTGSPDSKLFWDLNQVSKVNYAKRDSLQKYFEALMNTSGGNKKRIDSLNDAIEGPFDTLVNRQNRYLIQFLKGNLNSFASIAAIQQLNADKYLSYYVSLDSALSKKYPTSIYIKLFHDKVESTERTAIGVPAPEISLPDTNGKPINLSDFKGKVVLIDFWASWCGPCRASLPGIVKLYEKYKNKNFTILSVSLDKDKASWISAIHGFHLKWTNISDLKYWDSKVVQLYNFTGIPFSVLVSADGKILDKNMTEDDLDAELDKILSSSKIHG
jgi:thiol-disulfide isomerase/thioredoxin